MKYIYEARTNAFFPKALQEVYEKSGIWPLSGVEIEEETFAQYQNAPPGKVMTAGEDGYPTWSDIPPPTFEQQRALMDAEKQSRIEKANSYMSSRQWPGKAAIGRLKGEELVKYNEWLDYLDALEVVETSSVAHVEWPTPPATQAIQD